MGAAAVRCNPDVLVTDHAECCGRHQLPPDFSVMQYGAAESSTYRHLGWLCPQRLIKPVERRDQFSKSLVGRGEIGLDARPSIGQRVLINRQVRAFDPVQPFGELLAAGQVIEHGSLRQVLELRLDEAIGPNADGRVPSLVSVFDDVDRAVV